MKISKPVYAISSLALLLGIVVMFPLHAADIDTSACTFKGKKLYGKIQIVASFPDIKVRKSPRSPMSKCRK